MMDDSYESGKTKAGRPVWSHKTGDGYLESFLEGPEPEEAGGGPEPVQAERPLKERAIETLRQIYDPEIPVNVYDLGLIYGVEVDDDANVLVTMTLTTPHCPVAETMPQEVDMKLRSVEGVNDVDVEIVWDPPWDMSRMSDEARLELGLL